MAVDDSFTKSLLHMDGTDASTTFTDESGKTWTAAGNAQIDTAQSKFGGASGLFDGTGDYISASDSADWRLDGGSNSNEWTIDCWVRYSVDPTGIAPFIQQRVDNGNFWSLYKDGSDMLTFQVRSGSSNIVVIQNAWNPTNNTWYHIAVVKQGTTGYKMFVDGTQIGSTATDTDPIPDFSGGIQIARHTDSAGSNTDLNGWLDEFRVSVGIARWTTNFTPPTSAYAPAATSNFFPFF